MSNNRGSYPKRYALPYGASELQDLIEHRNMNFSVENMFKTCYRLGNCDHSDAEYDLRKILWFAERELKRIREGSTRKNDYMLDDSDEDDVITECMEGRR